MSSSTAQSFALMLETACRDFEVLLAIASGATSIVTNQQSDPVARAATMMALAKSFVFNAVRAGRICEHGASALGLSRQDRIQFLASMRKLTDVRDINEHGFDAKGAKARPSQHLHELHSASLDETSMVILGPDQILMGPLNLCRSYEAVARMRSLAGFQTLPLEQSGIAG